MKNILLVNLLLNLDKVLLKLMSHKNVNKIKSKDFILLISLSIIFNSDLHPVKINNLTFRFKAFDKNIVW